MSVAQDRPVEVYILSLSKDELAQDMLQPCGLISHRSWRLNLPVSTTFGSFFGGAGPFDSFVLSPSTPLMLSLSKHELAQDMLQPCDPMQGYRIATKGLRHRRRVLGAKQTEKDPLLLS